MPPHAPPHAHGENNPMSAAIDLPSPCVSVCEIDPVTRFCRGCLRTAAEIASWRDLNFDGKLDLLERLRGRRREMGLPVRRRTRRRRRAGAGGAVAMDEGNEH